MADTRVVWVCDVYYLDALTAATKKLMNGISNHTVIATYHEWQMLEYIPASTT